MQTNTSKNRDETSPYAIRRKLEEYLQDNNISYQELVDIKGKTVTLQLYPGIYHNQTLTGDYRVKIQNLFLILTVEGLIINFSSNAQNIEINLTLQPFEIPIVAPASKMLNKKVQTLTALGVRLFKQQSDNTAKVEVLTSSSFEDLKDKTSFKTSCDLYSIRASLISGNTVIGE